MRLLWIRFDFNSIVPIAVTDGSGLRGEAELPRPTEARSGKLPIPGGFFQRGVASVGKIIP